MKRLLYNPSVWIAIVIVIGITVFFALRSRGPQVTCVRARRTDLEQHIVASGRVMPVARVTVASLTSGLVVVVGAVEGQHVKKGDLLVQIDDAEALAQVAQARATVAQASAKVEQLKRVGAIVSSEGLRQAQTSLDSASSDLERNTQLLATGAISRAEFDETQRAFDVAKAKRTSAEAQLVGTLGADSRVAMSTYFQAKAQLTSAEIRLAQTKSFAAHDGVVLARSVEVGDVVQPSRSLLVVANDGDVELVFQPDERNLASISLGQHAKASADAFPQQVFDAEVNYIAPSIDPQRGTVEVHLRVPSPPAFLRPDMTVSVDLEVAKVAQVIVLPSETVHGLATPNPWVLAVTNDHTLRREVTLGIRGDGEVELTRGVDEGLLVVVPDGQVLTSGQRVRPLTTER